MLIVVAALLTSLPFYLLCTLAVAIVGASRRGASPWLRRARWLLIPAFVLVALAGSEVFANALMRHVEQRYPPRTVTAADRHPDNVILVLTYGWHRNLPRGVELKLGEDGWERLDAGVKLWRQISGTLLFAGAPSPDRSISVAAEMADAARTLGVPPEAILVEPRSMNTYENFTFSLSRLQAARGRLWLVTSALHLPRAMAVAHKLGLDPVPYPCFYRAHAWMDWVDWLPSNRGPRLLEDPMHEIVGLQVYRWRGWAE